MRIAPAIALLAVAAGSLTAAAEAAPKLPRCTTVDDAKGDSPDGALDITKVTYAKVGKDLVATIAVAKLADNAATAWGDRFQMTFKANDRAVEVYYKRSRTRDEEANVFYQSGLRVDGTFVSDAGIKAAYDLSRSTVTISIALTALKAGVGKSVDGATITDVGAVSQGSFIGVNQPSDTAASEKTFQVRQCAA